MVKATLCPESFKLCLKEGQMEDAMPTCKQMKIVAAQNDSPAVQLLLSSDQAATLLLTGSPYFSVTPKNPNIRVAVQSPFEAALFDVGMLPDDDGSLKADILIPADSVEIAAESLHALYLRFSIPEDAAPGSYEAVITLFENVMFGEETPLMSLTVSIEVLGVLMPSKRSFRLDLWQHLSNIARKHDVRLWSDEHFVVLEGYVRSLAELGQKSATIVAAEIPWVGQSCYKSPDSTANLFEYALIRVSREADGAFSYDFSAMDRYIALCESYGIAEEIEVFGITAGWGGEEDGFGPLAEDYPDYIRIRYFDHQDQQYRYMCKACQLDDYIRALERHFVQTGRMERVRVVADEPTDKPRFRAILDHLKEIALLFRFKAAINHTEFIGSFHEDIDVFSSSLECISKEWDLLSQYRKTYPQKEFLWYVCCFPSEFNTFIRSHLLESRLIGILTSYLELDGFLRWSYTAWTENPRKDIRYSEFPAGDLNFVYPASHGKPLLSLRYEQLKRGIEDFELLAMARQRGLSDAVAAFFEKVLREPDIKSFFTTESIRPVPQLCSLDACDYQAARELLLRALAEQSR